MNKSPDPVGQMPPGEAPGPIAPEFVLVDPLTGRITRPDDASTLKLVALNEVRKQLEREADILYQQVCKDRFEWLKPEVRAGFRRLRRQRDDIDTLMMGYAAGMDRVELPDRSEDLPAAATALLDAQTELAGFAPVAMRTVNTRQLTFLRDWFLFLTDLAGDATSYQHAVSALRSQTASSLDGHLRRVWRMVGDAVREDFDLNRRLLPVRSFISGAAELAAETRAKLDKARKDAVSQHIASSRPEPTPPRPPLPTDKKD